MQIAEPERQQWAGRDYINAKGRMRSFEGAAERLNNWPKAAFRSWVSTFTLIDPEGPFRADQKTQAGLFEEGGG